MKYVLNFKSDTFGKRLLTNRLECLKLHLTSIKQDGGKMGRDISFSSGEALFEFTDQITNLRNYYTIIENTDLRLKLFYLLK
jgi:hypothetical protein